MLTLLMACLKSAKEQKQIFSEVSRFQTVYRPNKLIMVLRKKFNNVCIFDTLTIIVKISLADIF